MTRQLTRQSMIMVLVLSGVARFGSAQSVPTTLRDAAERALTMHPAVRAASARLGGARASITDARSGGQPQLRVDAFGVRFQAPMVVAPLHGLDPQEPPLFDRTLAQLQASASLTLFDGGLRRARVGQAEAGTDLSASTLEAARSEVIMAVAAAWLDLATSRELLGVEEARVRALEAERDRVGQLVAVGRAAPLEALRVQAALESAGASRLSALQSVDVARLSLGRLLGLPVATLAELAPGAVRVAAPLPAVETLRQDARRENPEVLAAAARIAQAEAAARASASGKWPELRLVGGYTDYWSGDGRLTGEWQAGLRAGFPLLTGGGRRAAGERAGFDLDAAHAGREVTLLRLDTAVDQTAAAVESAGARAAALSAAVAQHREVVRIEQLTLDEGVGTRRDWIVATADLAAAQAALLEVRHAQVRARLELARLTGSLTLDALDTLLEVVP